MNNRALVLISRAAALLNLSIPATCIKYLKRRILVLTGNRFSYFKTKALLAIIFIILFNKAGAQAPTGYVLSTADEFTAPTLDTAMWKYRIGTAGLSFCRPENVVLDNGKLKVNLKRETYQGKNLTGGGVITKVPFRYGYFEVSVKMNAGHGWHDSFWTSWLSGFDDQNPAHQVADKREIDCFERYPDYANNYFTYGTIQWTPIKGNANRDFQTVTQNLTTSYNTFGFECTPDYINYFYNGSLLKTIDARQLPQHDIFLWLTSIGEAADASDSVAVYFDYLRCYTIDAASYNTRKASFIAHLDSLKLPTHSAGKDLWIEAENFKNVSNWTKELDENALVLKGFTSYLASRDSAALTASTGLKVDSAATYRLWVRSRDASTAPGLRKFKVIINGQPANKQFGTHGVNGYAWQDGGLFTLPAGTSMAKIYDSSQYFARCDKLLLTTDMSFTPDGIGGNSNVVYVSTVTGNVPFTAGNIVVARVGDGSSGLTLNSAEKVFLDEYTTSGLFVRSHSMPNISTDANKKLTLPVSTSDHTEGILTASPDGQYLALAGYDAAPGFASVSSSASATINRTVAIIDANGVVNTSTRLNTFTGTTARGAVTSNGTDIWVTGGSSGIRYTTTGATASTAIASQSGRSLNIFGGQLYGSTTATGLRIIKVGSGLPTTTGQTVTNLPGIPTTSGSPYGIYMADLSTSVAGVDVLYVTDEFSNVLSKYSLVSGSWVLNGRIGNSADYYWGLAGQTSGTQVTLYITRKNAGSTSGGGELAVLTDTSGYNGTFSGTPTALATAATNTLFKGVALAPESLTSMSVLRQQQAPDESFAGQMENNVVQLNWRTTNKTGQTYFDVYRMADGKNGEYIGRVPSKAIAGIQYAMSDYHPLEGTNQYALEQIDADGKVLKRSTTTVLNSKHHPIGFRIYQTDSYQSLHVAISSHNALEGLLQIIEINSGKILYKGYLKAPSGESDSVIQVKGLQPGLYSARYAVSGQVLNFKFAKQ
jgi:beta-glucanase (GH16 family)